MASSITTLDLLQAGQRGVVGAVGGDHALRRRLLEMGLVPGTAVSVLRRAPFGDPIEINLRGYLLSLRAEQARHVSLAMGAA